MSAPKSSIWSASLTTPGEIVEGIEHINQCIRIVLLTRMGTDPLRPEMGCGVFDKLDRPMNEVRAAVVNDVVNALNLWIPEITVIKVSTIAEPGALTVSVQWAFKDTIDTKQTQVTYGIS